MKLLSIILMVLSLGLSVQAADPEPAPTAAPGNLHDVFPLSDEQMTLPDFAERLSTPSSTDPNASTYTCRAWTTCYSGYRSYQISCWSRGYRCYAESTPGYRVYCSATSRSGYTEYYVAYCYY